VKRFDKISLREDEKLHCVGFVYQLLPKHTLRTSRFLFVEFSVKRDGGRRVSYSRIRKSDSCFLASGNAQLMVLIASFIALRVYHCAATCAYHITRFISRHQTPAANGYKQLAIMCVIISL